jgi:hypothetical protein
MAVLCGGGGGYILKMGGIGERIQKHIYGGLELTGDWPGGILLTCGASLHQSNTVQ